MMEVDEDEVDCLANERGIRLSQMPLWLKANN